jgi:hypothetical protein
VGQMAGAVVSHRNEWGGAREGRLALMQASFREDYQALEKRRGPTGSNYVVRPGRLMTCLTAMEVNLAADRAANQALLARLLDIRGEAMQVLQELAYR